MLRDVQGTGNEPSTKLTYSKELKNAINEFDLDVPTQEEITAAFKDLGKKDGRVEKDGVVGFFDKNQLTQVEITKKVDGAELTYFLSDDDQTPDGEIDRVKISSDSNYIPAKDNGIYSEKSFTFTEYELDGETEVDIRREYGNYYQHDIYPDDFAK